MHLDLNTLMIYLSILFSMRNVSDKRSGDNHAPSHGKTPQPAVRRCPVPGPEQKFSVQYIYIYFFSPRKSCRLRGNVEKYGGVRQATDDSIMLRRKDAICMPMTNARI